MAAGDPHPRRISCSFPAWPQSSFLECSQSSKPEGTWQAVVCSMIQAVMDLAEPGASGDLSGHLLAYLSLSPVFVIVGFVTLIIFKRELHTISFLGGLALNEGVNWLIKNVIQEPRPCGGPHTAVGTKYGMPSSHSQFMWFFSIYSFLFLYLRMHQTNNARFLDLLWRHVLSLGLLAAAFLVSYSRPVSEFFLIRDTSLIPNVLWFEYTVTRAEARNRQRKLGTKLQ
ncbi:PREDICTED: dolichyldiphosphatase 1 isoform X4 [Rhinopithecus bieti]|nr:PREDICTED: dolichyldiphosphatase 1 isoform X4 [Rhinopithecus bieti]